MLKDFVGKHPIAVAFGLVTGFGLLVLRRRMAAKVCRSKARLDGKTVLITGANTGIGKETALDMARRGARVIMACRDMTKAEIAAEEIRQLSGNSNVVVKKLDLASLESIEDLANDVMRSEKKLHILINNAGVMMCPKSQTKDGFEMQFGVNYLGHFVLTNSLMLPLKRSAPSRVVIVSSLAHERGEIHFDDINLDKDYKREVSYRQSKLANVLFARELSEVFHGTNVSVYCVDPGISNTELTRHLLPTFTWWQKILVWAFMKFAKSPREGAQTTIYCAVDEGEAKNSGLYYSDCAPKTPARQAQDKEAATRLWELSDTMIGWA